MGDDDRIETALGRARAGNVARKTIRQLDDSGWMDDVHSLWHVGESQMQ